VRCPLPLRGHVHLTSTTGLRACGHVDVSTYGPHRPRLCQRCSCWHHTINSPSPAEPLSRALREVADTHMSWLIQSDNASSS
jgi:hypothetical protein